MRLVNLTPHEINLTNFGKVEPSSVVARVSTAEEEFDNINGLPLVRQTFGEVEGLPAPVEGTIYIVSSIVRSACSGRDDVCSPGRFERNEKGQITGAGALVF